MADVGIHIEDMSKAANPSNINAADGEIHGTSEQVPAVFMLCIAEILTSVVDEGPKIKGIYEKVFEFKPSWQKIRFLALANIARLGRFALLWMVITLRIPSLKSETILGTVMWKWSSFAAVIFCGYPCALIAISTAIVILEFIHDPAEEHDKAYFWRGLCNNVSWLLYFASVLVVWLACFHTEQGLNKNPEILDKYVTRTLVSCLVGAVLGVAKAVVVLHWNAKAIYRRFKPRILMAGFQLYFLCIIVNEFARHSLMPWRYRKCLFGLDEEWEVIKDRRETHTTADEKRRSIQDYFLSTRISLAQLCEVAGRLASLAQVLREDDGVAEVEQKCREKILSKGDEQYITKECIVNLFKELYEDPAECDQRCIPWIFRKIVDSAYYLTTIVVSKTASDEDDKQRKLENIAAGKDKFVKELLQEDRPSPPVKTLSGDDCSGGLLNDCADLLLEELKVQQSSDKITPAILSKWMVDAHKDCLSLGYTLVDAFAVVDALDWVLTWSIVAVVILFWLLVTGLATTKVLVTIVSAFLALTFMFGDTFKAFFQGVIFSFATHPFDVGDECFIDGEELVVKNINILTTTFHGNKNKDIVLIPNSNLATKRIAVHKPGTKAKTETKDASTQPDDSPRHESPAVAAAASLS